MSEIQEPELLPCPFCGGEADYESNINRYGFHRVSIYCVECHHRGNEWQSDNKEQALRFVTKDWNRRVPAVGQWTTEPPKEGGFYAMHWGVTGIYDARFLDDEQYMQGKSVEEKINFVQKSLSIAYPGALWIKLDVPPLPEGKESKE